MSRMNKRNYAWIMRNRFPKKKEKAEQKWLKRFMRNREEKVEGKLVSGGYARFNEYGELVEEGTLRPRNYDYKRVKKKGGLVLKAIKKRK